MKKVQEDWKEEMLQVGVLTNTHGAVSYTHLDVYKRQGAFRYRW